MQRELKCMTDKQRVRKRGNLVYCIVVVLSPAVFMLVSVLLFDLLLPDPYSFPLENYTSFLITQSWIVCWNILCIRDFLCSLCRDFSSFLRKFCQRKNGSTGFIYSSSLIVWHLQPCSHFFINVAAFFINTVTVLAER